MRAAGGQPAAPPSQAAVAGPAHHPTSRIEHGQHLRGEGKGGIILTVSRVTIHDP